MWSSSAVRFLFSYWLFRVLHEFAHLITAYLVGCNDQLMTAANIMSALFESRVFIVCPNTMKSKIIRHAGWISSCIMFIVAAFTTSWPTICAAALTALDAVCSDLFELHGIQSIGWYYCGNFGILLLGEENRDRALSILRTMIRVTMVRGAQSGGIVTYVPQGKGTRGIRSRVVNGKRTDLSALLTSKLWKDQIGASLRFGLGKKSRFYGGHTRFATSSKASFDGTHPHQWTPRENFVVWTQKKGEWHSESTNVEVYITHNGDLDFWTVSGVTYPVDDIFPWLEKATHSPCPSAVDSACVAGIVDLVRTKGSWYHSVRFGFLFGPERKTLHYKMPSKKEVSDCFATTDGYRPF
jgi:hypothetical protein